MSHRIDESKGVKEYTGLDDLVYAAVVGNQYVRGQYYANGAVAGMYREDYEQNYRAQGRARLAAQQAFVPTLSSLSIALLTVGDTAVVVLTGTNFTHLTRVTVNGTEYDSTFVNSTTINFSFTPSEEDDYEVKANNPGKLGGTSSGQTIEVLDELAAPVISSLDPDEIEEGAGDTEVTVNGTGFSVHSTATVEDDPVDVEFVSATELTITVPTAALAAAGTITIEVTNPGTIGGGSDDATLEVTAA